MIDFNLMKIIELPPKVCLKCKCIVCTEKVNCGLNNVNFFCFFLHRLTGLSPFLGDDDNETLNNILACRWDFEEEEFENVSEEAKDFITKLLIKEKR